MKRSSFLRALAFFASFLLLTFAMPPWIPKQSYFGALESKLRILKSTHSPRIILVGGSNVSYGLDSTLIEQTLRYPVVNMGFVFSTGMRYNLQLIKDDLQAGDIVVLSPEYGSLGGLIDGDCVVLEVAEVNPFSVKYILGCCAESLQYTEHLIKTIIFYPAKKWRDVIALIGKIYNTGTFEPKMLKPEGGRKYYFDEHGDFVMHLVIPKPNPNYVRYQDPVNSISDEAADLLNQFNSFALSRGARVVLIPPPVPLKYPPFMKLQYENDEAWPGKSISIPILSQPQRYRFPLKDFYEVPYHLNLEGREKRTAFLCEDLKRYLKSQHLWPYQ